MVDSQSLRLVFALREAHDALTSHVSRALIGRGYDFASPAVLHFLSELECGENHASEVARRLGVSRQMVSKTVAEMSQLGVLRVSRDPDRGNQNVIGFTPRGVRLMADARQVLAELDEMLGELDGKVNVGLLNQILYRLKTKLAGNE